MGELSREAGRRLRAERSRLDVTSRELAIACGVSAGTVRAVEGGKQTRASTFRRIVRALGVFDANLDAHALADELLAVVGPELAAESLYPGQLEKVETKRDDASSPEQALATRDGRQRHEVLQDALSELYVTGNVAKFLRDLEVRPSPMSPLEVTLAELDAAERQS